MYYYLSLGSNLSPEKNIASVLMWLVHKFKCVSVYPIIETVPEDLDTQNSFLNTLCIIYSDLDKLEIKMLFNEQEERLGRDRSDPSSSHKDRTADIDILVQSEEFNPDKFLNFQESYIQKVFQTKANAVALKLGESFLGDRPSTIYFNSTTGQIRIINDKIDGLNDWVKSRLITE